MSASPATSHRPRRWWLLLAVAILAGAYCAAGYGLAAELSVACAPSGCARARTMGIVYGCLTIACLALAVASVVMLVRAARRTRMSTP